MKLSSVGLVVLLALTACQTGEAPSSLDSDVGLLADLPADLLTRPLPLVPELGRPYGSALTSSSEADGYYRQGLAYLDGFAWLQAVRSFHEALRRDPNLTVAQAGLARAYLGLEAPAEALAAGQAAVSQISTSRPPASDRPWIELTHLQMAAVAASGLEREQRLAKYRRAVDRFVAERPDDPQALVLRGHAETPGPDGWGQAGGRPALFWYRQALKVDSEHAPAHHFLAHTYENLGRHDRALEHAERYAAVADTIPHAHHMVAHAAPYAGRWEEARERLRTADRLHRRALEEQGLAPEHDWHFGHNLRLLAAVELHLGNTEAAEAAFRETFQIPYHGRRAGFYCLPWLEYLLYRHRYPEALLAARQCEQRDSILARVVGASVAGEAALAQDDLAAAEAALERAQRASQELERSLRPLLGEHVFRVTASRSVSTLQGLIDLAQDRPATRLLEVAESLAATRHSDGWASGDLRLTILIETAERRDIPELARELLRLRDAQSVSRLPAPASLPPTPAPPPSRRSE